MEERKVVPAKTTSAATGDAMGGGDRATAPRELRTLANEGGFLRTTSAAVGDAMGRTAAVTAAGVAMGRGELRRRGLRTLANEVGFLRTRTEGRFLVRVGGRLLIEARCGKAGPKSRRLGGASASGGQNPPRS